MRLTVSGALTALLVPLLALPRTPFCSLPVAAQTPAAQSAASATARTITFRYRPAKPVRSVSLAGSFNGWNRSATPLQRQSDGKAWQTTLPLAPGVYQYKFVIDDNIWVPDPNAPRVDDGNGNINSQLLLAPADYALRPGRIGDGIITTSAVLHLPDRDHVSRRDETHFAFLLRTRHNDVQSCTLVWQEEPEKRETAPRFRSKRNEHKKGNERNRHLNTERPTPNARSVPMLRSDSDPLYDTWRGIANLSSRNHVHYAFLLHDGKRTLTYRDTQITDSAAGVRSRALAGGFTLDPTRYPTLRVPDWPRDAVFYQIFPERFANGDPTNDGPDVQPWGAKPTFDNRMGGDLAGVQQHLDYLRDLGVNALYFNPIFAARSNHGYDTTDYLRVDPRFGTNELLADLVADCHRLGWHVILDGVFNHTGVDAAPFKSLREQGEQSPYRDWYCVKKFPLEVSDEQQTYVGWYGSPWLPKLNLANPATRQFMLGVATTWIERAKIDGWRLDAADEVAHDYWIDFRHAVRDAAPNAYIVGEIWGDAHAWLQGDQFDSVMNYRWRGAVLDFFAQDRLTPSGFERAIARMRDDYPEAATAVMFNILDSHDTERIRNLCRGDWPRERQAVLFQMTYPGTPCIYYGDEIGMEGARDPDDRRCMVWNKTQWNQKVLGFYRRAVALRRSHPALRRGDYRMALADDHAGLYAFTRTCGSEHVLIVFNRSDSPQQAVVPLAAVGGTIPYDWLPSGAAVQRRGNRLLISLPARGIAVYGN